MFNRTRTDDEELRRAEEAQRILGSPIFEDAFAEVRDQIVTAMAESKLNDKDGHQSLVIALQQLAKVKAKLITHVETGQLVRAKRAEWRNAS